MPGATASCGTTIRCHSESRRATRFATRDGRRLGLEHVRFAGNDRLVPAARRPLRAPRRVERARRQARLAADREERGRTDGRRRRRRGARRRVAGARVDACARRPDDRISVVANTVDVARLAEAADALAPRRDTLRAEAGIDADDVVVLSVARLAPEKGLDTLVRAAAAAGEPRLVVALAGSGPERERLASLAAELGVRLVLLPDIPWERIVERYAVADVFALLSRHEPWGVVVNEAAACGLPLVLSDRVGAAFDLLEDGRNGRLVPVDDAAAAGDALRELAADPALRRAMGAASREIVAGWGYEPSIERLVAVVRRVAGRQPASASA